MSSPAAAIHPADGAALESTCARSRRCRWTLYDFANTIFSFAVVSGAMGLWLVRPEQFGEATGQLVFSLAILVSVGLNAIVSPILGALSDRGGRRLPFLLAVHRAVRRPTALIALGGPLGGLVLFIVANFAYQVGAHLLRRLDQARQHAGDARPDVGDRRRGSGTAARCSSGC